MNTRAAAVGGCAQTDSMGHDDEPPADGAIGQSRPTFGNKKARRVGAGADPVSYTCIRPELLSRGEVDRNQSRLVEFGLTHGEDPLAQVDIVAVQTDRLTHPHSRDGQ